MPCFACNPYCGKCKPPREKPRRCESCQKYCFKPEEIYCPVCGAELPPRILPPVVKCGYSGLICANPCGKSKLQLETYSPCPLNTPPT